MTTFARPAPRRRASRLRVVAGLLVLLAAACSSVYSTHGYAPSDADLATVVVGRSDRDAVTKAVGRPGASGVLEDAAWYYVQSRWRDYAYKAPEVIDRQVVAISFDPRGTVRNIERFGLEKGRVVPLSRRVTATDVRGTGFVGQLLRNIGNFRGGEAIQQAGGVR